MIRRVTTQDISWFLDLYNNGQLDLDPSYQRRSVWSVKDKRFFLDTIFRGYPSPSIFLHKVVVDGKTVYAVVDGKQRLETIIDFTNNKIFLDKNFGDSKLDGKKWRHMQNDPELAHLFWDYVVPVEFINITDDTMLVNEVFDRLNRSSRKLVEQELRHAKFDGWFITFVEQETDDPDWRDLGIATRARAKRMKDVQFLSELLIILLKGQVQGFDQNEINVVYADYEDPLEFDPDFDELEIKNKFVVTRKYIVGMENSNSCVSEYAKDFKDFYSLWSLVALNNNSMPAANLFASAYSDFMGKVNFQKNQESLDPSERDLNQQVDDNVNKYYRNSLGASTEPPQRKERYIALKTALLDALAP